ncbi:MAG: hypothetical protein H7A38_03290 [Chlamydiales bacterium]|nr:hypothetical protein [Chlamydiales bacterium]
MTTPAYGSTTPFNTTFNHWIPRQYKYEGLKNSYLIDCIQTISHHTNRDGSYSMVMARVWAAVLPIAAGASLIQNMGVTFAHLLSSNFGANDHCHSVNSAMEKETQQLSFTQDLIDLAYHVAATVSSVILYVPLVFAPGLIQMTRLNALPKSHNEKELERLKNIASQSSEAIAKAGRVDEAEKLALRLTEENERLSKINEDVACDLEAERKKTAGQEKTIGQLEESLRKEATSKEEAITTEFFRGLLPVTPETVSKLPNPVECLHLAGMTFKRYSGGVYKDYSQPTWGLSEGYVQKGTHFKDTPISNNDLFLIPSGLVELSIDMTALCKSMTPEALDAFLAKPHHVHRLKLKGVTPEELKNPKYKTLLAHVHTLVLESPSEQIYSSTELVQLSAEYPRIACFDLSACQFDKQEDLKPLMEVPDEYVGGTERMVLYPKFVERSVSFGAQKDNLQKMMTSLNHYLHKIVTEYDSSRPDEFGRYFPLPDDNKLFHPAAPFMTKMSFLSGSEIRTTHLISLLEKIPRIFPHLEVLDFQRCFLLESDVLNYLGDLVDQLKIEHLYLHGCDLIYYRTPISTDNISQKNPADHTLTGKDLETKFGVTETKDRQYLLNLFTVTQTLSSLFDKGIKRIRLDKAAVGHKKEKEIFHALESGVNPTIARVNKPPRSSDAKIYFGTDAHYP